jgi:hypothetical protein
MSTRTISSLTCLRCGYSWLPRSERTPVRCPRCKSPYWNKASGDRAADPMAAKAAAMQAGRRYYWAHEREIIRQHRGKFVAVTAEGVIDADEKYADLIDRIYSSGPFSLFIHKAGEPERVYRIGPRFSVRSA